MLALGLAFLHAPMLLIVVFSFNASRLVSVWGGFSTQWYGALLSNEPLKAAIWTSLRVALASSLLATILGTLAAWTLVRGGRFIGRPLFTGMVYGPLVMPEVITGLSLLLLFVGLGIERGLGTVILAHATLGLAFVTIVVQSRLVALDRTLEEAALDLGASPAIAFLTVTLPLLAPAIGAGFLLSFTLSLDDLVLASFASGPGATTLPMLIFGQVRRGVTPEINAIATLILVAVTILVGGRDLAYGAARAGSPLTGRDPAGVTTRRSSGPAMSTAFGPGSSTPSPTTRRGP